MNTEHRRANEQYFEKVALLSKSFLWKDYGHYIPIEERDGKNVFVCDKNAYRSFVEHTTPEWVKKNVCLK
jgi:hypothetical protein